ncbi:hypothetical protein [Tumebacillus avium]|nr:hypothetical protein [Tumebacillus avium]
MKRKLVLSLFVVATIVVFSNAQGSQKIADTRPPQPAGVIAIYG